MGGRPWTCTAVDVDGWVMSVVEGSGDAEVDVGEKDLVERRVWASAMTVSAHWRECWRIDVFDWRVPLREFNEEISAWRVAMALCRECDWEVSEWAADSDCEMLDWTVSASVLETAFTRASFSGFGGIGGAGPVGAKEGSSSSKGEVRRSGAGACCFGAVCTGAGVGVGIGCVVGVACESCRW